MVLFLMTFVYASLGQAIIHASETEEGKFWVDRSRHWLKELSLFQQAQISDNLIGADESSISELPMWLAAQRAVSRYEGFLSAAGPRGRLLRKLLSWIGLIPRTSETSFHMDADNNSSEPYLRFAEILFIFPFLTIPFILPWPVVAHV